MPERILIDRLHNDIPVDLTCEQNIDILNIMLWRAVFVFDLWKEWLNFCTVSVLVLKN